MRIIGRSLFKKQTAEWISKIRVNTRMAKRVNRSIFIDQYFPFDNNVIQMFFEYLLRSDFIRILEGLLIFVDKVLVY